MIIDVLLLVRRDDTINASIVFIIQMLAKSPKYVFYLIYFSVLVIVAVHFILNLGLSYTDSNGCYRAYTPAAGNLTQGTKSFFDPLQAQCQVLTS
jgi:hypothetical protein